MGLLYTVLLECKTCLLTIYWPWLLLDVELSGCRVGLLYSVQYTTNLPTTFRPWLILDNVGLSWVLGCCTVHNLFTSNFKPLVATGHLGTSLVAGLQHTLFTNNIFKPFF